MRKDDEGTWQCFCFCRRRCHVRVEGVALGVTGIAPPQTPLPLFPLSVHTRTVEHLCLCVCVRARTK